MAFFARRAKKKWSHGFSLPEGRKKFKSVPVSGKKISRAKFPIDLPSPGGWLLTPSSPCLTWWWSPDVMGNRRPRQVIRGWVGVCYADEPCKLHIGNKGTVLRYLCGFKKHIVRWLYNLFSIVFAAFWHVFACNFCISIRPPLDR